MNIEREDRRIKRIKDVKKNIEKNKHGKLYIWGCSQTSRMITEFCNKYSELSIEAYVVDDEYYQVDIFENKQVYKASEWRTVSNEGDFVVFGFTNSKRAEQIKQTLPEGVEGIYLCFPYSANVDGNYLTYEEFENAQSRFEKVNDLLTDEFSKQVMETFINACITGDMGQIEELEREGQYFNSLTQNCNYGCFVDLGAYIGDTIESAFHFYGEKLEKVIAFEPDPSNIILLKERVRECGIPDEKIQLIPKGSWSKKDTLFFSLSNSSSSISDTGEVKIEVESLDEVLKDTMLSVSYIKMDVEGSEEESLKGAQSVIQKYHPILAVCVYHKPEDLYTIPELIQKMVGRKEYNYYLRYHGSDLRELVLYAIPVK